MLTSSTLRLLVFAFAVLPPHFASSQEQAAPKTKLDDPAFKKWRKSVAALPAEKQVEAVIKKMQEFNSGYNGKYEETSIVNGEVRGLYFLPDPTISDVSPLCALPATMVGVNCANNKISDLTPLKGMRLKHLSCSHTQVKDLTPLKGMPLDHLYCESTRISDLTPLVGAPLEELEMGNAPVTDLTPLKGMPLNCLVFTLKNVTKGMEVLRGIKTLETIIVKTGDEEEIFTPEEFWKMYDAREFKK